MSQHSREFVIWRWAVLGVLLACSAIFAVSQRWSYENCSVYETTLGCSVVDHWTGDVEFRTTTISF